MTVNICLRCVCRVKIWLNLRSLILALGALGRRGPSQQTLSMLSTQSFGACHIGRRFAFSRKAKSNRYLREFVLSAINIALCYYFMVNFMHSHLAFHCFNYCLIPGQACAFSLFFSSFFPSHVVACFLLQIMIA